MRELADSTGLSVGTIRRAYDELQRMNMIEMTQGRGTFIRDTAEENTLISKKERAEDAIDNMLDELLNLGFSYREIEILFGLSILKRQENKEKIIVAIVDCNPESISLIENQLLDIHGINIVNFLLDNVQRSPFKLIGNYDIIVTTHTHYELLTDILYQEAANIAKVVMTTSDQTIMELNGISLDANIGIWCQSPRFARIAKNGIEKYSKSGNKVVSHLVAEKFDFEDFLKNTDVLIVSPNYLSFTNKEALEHIQQFKQRDGSIIQYNYQTDRGSLMFLRERILELVSLH